MRAHRALDVVNGQRNDIFVTVENKSDRNVTLQSIAGSLHHPDTNKLVKNVRETPSRQCCLSDMKFLDYGVDVQAPPA